MKPLFKKGYNVTCDNFFTSLKLARDLLAEKTTLVGTVRRNSIFLSEEHKKKLDFQSSKFYVDDSKKVLTVNYQGKKKNKSLFYQPCIQNVRLIIH